jgi:Alb1
VRHEKGLSRAEAIMDQMEKKVEVAQTRVKTRKDRSAMWEDINDISKEETRKAPKFQVLAHREIDDDEADWSDVPQHFEGDTEMKVVDGVQVPVSAAAVKLTLVDRLASATPSVAGDFDGIT